jgi:hypothetical protein
VDLHHLLLAGLPAHHSRNSPRSAEHHGGGHAARPERADEGRGLPVAVGNASSEPLAARRAAVDPAGATESGGCSVRTLPAHWRMLPTESKG